MVDGFFKTGLSRGKKQLNIKSTGVSKKERFFSENEVNTEEDINDHFQDQIDHNILSKGQNIRQQFL